MKIAVVGAGLYGATIAYLARDAGHEVMVLESDSQIAGNIRSHWDPRIGSHVSEFGAHIFHTNSERIWTFVNQFASFNGYRHYVKGWNGHTMIDLPFSMSMMSQILDLHSPEVAQAYFKRVREAGVDLDQSNIEGWCIANIGSALYKTAIKDYTEKQWGRPCSELPASIVQRLPIRFSYDNTYFHNAKYQGMPNEGYTNMVENILDCVGVPRVFDHDVGSIRLTLLEKTYDRVFFSGMIDKLMHYKFGVLAYRGLHFEHKYLEDVSSFQGAPVVNDLTHDVDYTRIIEHKHFYPGLAQGKNTIITEEYPKPWAKGDRAYYPVRDAENLALYSKYETAAAAMFPKTKFGGRLGTFSYLDMDQVIGMAMSHAKEFQ